MNCPACAGTLRTRNIGPIEADICQQCGGVWLDRFELKKVDEKHETVELPSVQAGPVGTDGPRRCPKCSAAHVLRKRLVSPKISVAIDECPGCAGIFLDAGELEQVRNREWTAKERQNAAVEAFTPHLEASPVGDSSFWEVLRRLF